MGVPGLWDLLRPAATRSSLSALAKTAYQTNRHGLRAVTIGIDASLWLFHAQTPTAGENPALRTIFFKICTLLQQPVLPIFVFDGPQKPASKRGNNVGRAFGTSDKPSLMFKALLNECGLEWWNAPGEAEAELAVMNRQGKIDAVLSDDVDALLFGATCLLRNNSATLSGTQASSHVPISKGDMKTYEIYRSSTIAEIWTSKTNTTLRTEEDCRMAMVLVALLAGGDYVPEGLGSFGAITAFALAHAGLSEQLPVFMSNPSRFSTLIPEIKAQMIEELRTNASGHIGRKNPARAKTLSELPATDIFPLSSMSSYLHPATSPLADLSAGWPGFGEGEATRTRGTARNGGRGDLEGFARSCEKYFEWGTRELVCKKFAGESTGVYGAEILVDARRKRMEADKAEKNGGAKGGPSVQGRLTSYFGATSTAGSSSLSKPTTNHRSPSPGKTSEVPSYILRIERTRPDPTCPELTEYRILYDTKIFNERVNKSMTGTRIDPKFLTPEERISLGMVPIAAAGEDDEDAPSASQAKADEGQARIWIADWLVKDAYPSVVADWDEKQAAKNAKAVGKGRTKSAGSTTPKKGTPKKGKAKAAPKGVKKATNVATPAVEEEEDADVGFEKYFGSTQARVSPPQPDMMTQSQPAETEAGPSRRFAPKANSSKPPSTASTGTRSASATSRPDPRAGAGTVIVIEDSDEEVSAPLDPKRKALVLSSTPTPPRWTSSRTTRKASSKALEIPSSPLPITRSKSPHATAGPSRPRPRQSRTGSSTAQPIMIMSSDEEEAPRTRTVSPPDSLDRFLTRRPRRAVLSPSSRQNTSSPPPRSSPTLQVTKTARGKSPLHTSAHSTSARPQVQSGLGMPVVASSSRSTTSPSKEITAPSTPRGSSSIPLPTTSPSKSRTAARSSPSPLPEDGDLGKGRNRPRRSYVVLVDGGEEGGGVIDCTRGGRLLKDTRRWGVD